eukprot:XP_011670770.1 PREDICTED: zinc finger CCCH domain-containing protein 7B-like [Strongylocentrotus purpuratus]
MEIHELSCCYCHSREEQDIWVAEKEGRFPRDNVIALLKTQGQHDQGKSKRKRSTPARSRSESLVSQDNGDYKSWSNSGVRPRRESQLDQGVGNTKYRSNSVARSRSGILQTSNLGCSSQQHEDVETQSLNSSDELKEMYEATSGAVTVKNPFEILQDEDRSAWQISGVKTSSRPPNQNSRITAGTFPKSSGLPFRQAGMNVLSRKVVTASSVCNSPGLLCAKSNNPQTFQKVTGHSVVMLDETLLNELKRIGGKFLVVCMQCFESKPMKISPPHPNNPTVCSYEKHSMTMMPERYLVHQFGGGKFTAIRERPFRVMHKPTAVCRYVDRMYGCERGDSCYFAHSEAEAKVWGLEASFGKERIEILEACTELNRQAATKLSPAGSRASIPNALINPHQGAWGINSSRLKQPPSGACAIAVESCHSKVPFDHSIKLACGRCLPENPYRIQGQSSKSPSYCTGTSRHSWGANILYVVHSSKDKKWVRVNSRHPRLRSHTKLHLCLTGKQCKQESVFGTACMNPHTQEELELWEYQKRHNLTKLEEVVRLQQQAHAASVPLPEPEHTDVTQHTCSFCKFSSTSKTDFENHLLTTDHKAMIFSDSDRLWKERDPPNLVQDGCYEMCKE